MDGEPELLRKRIAVWAGESKLINSGGNVLSANFFHVFLRAGPLLTADRFAPHRREQSGAMLGLASANSSSAIACLSMVYRGLRSQVLRSRPYFQLVKLSEFRGLIDDARSCACLAGSELPFKAAAQR